MVYGTGYTRSLDIAAHEVMHGVIASEADLIYVNESGALNESFADFLGTLASRSGSDDDWLIGEDLPVTQLRTPSVAWSSRPQGLSKVCKLFRCQQGPARPLQQSCNDL
jgi:Zn-dependent metalloprotease